MQLHRPCLTDRHRKGDLTSYSLHINILVIMSFGIAVGDFIAVGKLVYDITDCLQTARTANEDYQELIRELQTLDLTLRHLDRLGHKTPTSQTLDSIKLAALSCRYSLGKFLEHVRKYDASLGVQSRLSLVQSARRRIQWTVAMKNDCSRMQNYLHMHIGTINILLTGYGLERVDLASEAAELSTKQIHTQLDASQSLLSTISNNVSAQMLVVRSAQSMLANLHQLVSGELQASWNQFGEAVAQV